MRTAIWKRGKPPGSCCLRSDGHASLGGFGRSAPGGVQIKPARRVEPAGPARGNVKHSVALETDGFRAVPFQKISGGLADTHGIGECPEADGTAISLIAHGPAEDEDQDPQHLSYEAALTSACSRRNGVSQVAQRRIPHGHD